MTFSPRSLNRLLRLLTWITQYNGTGLVKDLKPEDAQRAYLITRNTHPAPCAYCHGSRVMPTVAGPKPCAACDPRNVNN